MERHRDFYLNYGHQLAKDLVFAGLGRHSLSTDYHDSSLYGKHGTLTAMDPATDCVWDSFLGRWTLDFDGSDDYVTCPFSIALPFTMSGWFRFPSVSASAQGLSINDPTVTNKQYALGNSPGAYTKWGFSVRNAATLFTTAAGGTSAANNWVHLCGVASSTTLRTLYANGIAVATSTDDIAHPATTTLDIGRLGDSTPQYYASRSADVCIYARALSDSEIAALADPSNALLSGLILPPKQRIWAAVTAAPATPAGVPVFGGQVCRRVTGSTSVPVFGGHVCRRA